MPVDWVLEPDDDWVEKDLEAHIAMLIARQKRGFRFLHRRSKTAPGTAQHAWSYGLRVGYWPCHRGPFISIEFATHRIDIWYGTPSLEES